jgi:hypothetical protein
VIKVVCFVERNNFCVESFLGKNAKFFLSPVAHVVQSGRQCHVLRSFTNCEAMVLFAFACICMYVFCSWMDVDVGAWVEKEDEEVLYM